MLYQTPLVNVMFGIGFSIASALAVIPVVFFSTGIGPMTLHAFGFISPPF